MEGKLEYDLSELEALRVELDKLSYDAWITVDALVHLIVNKVYIYIYIYIYMPYNQIMDHVETQWNSLPLVSDFLP